MNRIVFLIIFPLVCSFADIEAKEHTIGVYINGQVCSDFFLMTQSQGEKNFYYRNQFDNSLDVILKSDDVILFFFYNASYIGIPLNMEVLKYNFVNIDIYTSDRKENRKKYLLKVKRDLGIYMVSVADKDSCFWLSYMSKRIQR